MTDRARRRMPFLVWSTTCCVHDDAWARRAVGAAF